MDKMSAQQSEDVLLNIRVLTLNCWGLKLFAKMRPERMKGIVRYIRENDCDIVFLQEIWVTSDFDTIREETKDIYKFAHLFKSKSVLGSSGIVLLTKWSPKVIHFEQYSLNGSPFYFWHGDWFAGKGIAYSRVDLDRLSLHLFSTHTHAYYNENETIHDQYSVHRICQSFQLARFISLICDRECNRRSNSRDLLIVAGDMNSTSSELPYKILTVMAGLADCFKVNRYYNFNSNIIHQNKLLALKHKLFNRHISTRDGHEVSSGDEASGSKSKRGDSFILDTLEDYRNRIAQALHFDSDTEDEDTTYCHPKNSFTGKIKSKSNDDTAKKKDSVKEAQLQKDTISVSDGTSGYGLSVGNSTQSIYKPKNGKTNSNPMKRIDFILCRLLSDGCCIVDRIKTDTKDLQSNCSLSDHEPVMVNLKLIKSPSSGYLKSDQPHGDAVVTTSSTVHRRQSLDLKNGNTCGDNFEVAIGNIDDHVVLESVSDNDANLHSHVKNVMKETQSILLRYYESNRQFKTNLFYFVLVIYFMVMPIVTYCAIVNELLPISTIVFMWFSISFPVAAGILIGFVYHRSEQAALEAILSDINCRVSVAMDQEAERRSAESLDRE